MKVHLLALSLVLLYLGTMAFATAPSITSFSPTSGAVGQKVTLHGGLFTTTTCVQFNGIAATYSMVSAAYITVIVPAGATTGPITVTTFGGTTTSATKFTVLQPPTITTIANQLINMGTSTSPLAFTVSDPVTPVASLTVTCASSNTALVPTTGIVSVGPSSLGLCAVTLTPRSTYSGVTTITLTVTNGAGLTTTTHFTLTVDRPTISGITNQTTPMSTSTAALAFTVGDNITPVAALTVTGASNNYALVPNVNILIGGSGAARTVMVTPVSRQGGVTTITLTVTNGGGVTATTRFTVTIQSGNNPTDGASLVWVPGGSFTMGSTIAQDGGVASGGETQRVTLSGYWIYKYPVTVAQYRAFCASTGHSLPPYPADLYTPWSQNSNWTGTVGNLQQTPIVNVTWTDADAYCTWGKRTVSLPTEAQYEYAARGTAESNYPWGGTATSADSTNGWDQTKCANWYISGNVGKSTWPVGSFPAGASWCGAQDQAGNVWEWCADWYSDYSAMPVTNPTGPTSGIYRVMRGGAWLGDGLDNFRAAYRFFSYQSNCYNSVGFRCVLR